VLLSGKPPLVNPPQELLDRTADSHQWYVQAEKLFGVHDKAFPLRVLARLPVGALSA